MIISNTGICHAYTHSNGKILTNITHKNRHVILPKSLKAELKRNRLMEEEEWRAIGVTQSRGWMHYMIHAPGTIKFC